MNYASQMPPASCQYPTTPTTPVLTDKVGAKLWGDQRGLKSPETYFYRVLDEYANAETKGLRLRTNQRARAAVVDQTCSALPSVETLPESFAFKATHTSGCNLLVVDGIIVGHRPCVLTGMANSRVGDAQSISQWTMWLRESVVADLFPTFAQVVEWAHTERSLMGRVVDDRLLYDACTRWLAQQYARTAESYYSKLVPSLLIEKVIEDATELASDLKCFVFSGQTRFIQHVDSRFTADKRDTFYRCVLQDSGVQRWEG